MVWVQFFISAALMVLAAVFLARYGDVIALRTRLGGMLIGTILLAGATSMPELLTTINSLSQGVPNLAVGNLFGSSMFNIFLLAVLDIVFWRTRVLRRVAMKHALTGALATMLMGMAVFFILTPLDIQIAWVGLDSLLILAMYFFGLWVIRSSGLTSRAAKPPAIPPRTPSLLHAVVGFALATAVLVVVSPWMVRSSAEIATLTGLGTGFVGAQLVAIATSLPEVVTVIAAIRLGAYDLAVGNLFGSNVFNMFALASTDVFYFRGRFLGRIDSSFAVVGMMALLLTTLGVIGNLARLERKLLFVEVDALLLIVGYGLGMWLLYTLGIGV